jgi:VanZ family protein
MSITPRMKAVGIAILVLLIAFAALGPAKWQVRTGLGWQFDHFIGYFVFTLMVCVAWPRPALVAGAIIVLAALLEGLQALTPDRTADLNAVLWSSAGVLAAALPPELFIQTMRRKARILLPLRLGRDTLQDWALIRFRSFDNR